MGWHGHWHRMGDEDERYTRRTSYRALIGRMLRYAGKFRRRGALLTLAVLSNTLISLLPPFLFTLAIDRYIAALDFVGLTLLALAFVAVSLSTFAAQFAQRYLINWLGAKMEYEMRMDMFRHLQRLPLRYFADREVGRIVSRVTNDVDKISELITSGLTSAIADLVTLCGIVAFMLWMDTRLSLITFTVIPMVVAFMLLGGRRVRTVYRRTRRTIASVSAKIEESVSGMREIQSFSRERATRREFEEANISNMEANVEAGRIMSAFWPAVGIFSAVGNCLVLWFGGTAVMRGTLTVGVLFGFMSYLDRFFWPIQDLSMFWNNVQSAMAAAERVFDILDTEVEIEERPDARRLPRIRGEIAYEGVTFGYDPDQPVLRGIDLTIEANTTVALVGPTGAGKTTMINLLYRFYDPQEGRITVDGHDLRDVELESLRSQMAIVLQDPFLFSGTVMENIRYGNPEATEEEVIAIARAVGAHDFIEALPEGYGTDVRERGGRLSMGQRQLVSLARALLADPRILIMDEATSSVDAYTELIIRQALGRVLRDRTSIVIAHRLSTVRNADLIIVLDEGRIVERGRHDELMERGGLYRRLYEMQFKYEEPGGGEEVAELAVEVPRGEDQ
ncbi:MAG: ABC transporter ATP-binding protein [Candidatus Bathyarchaeia archaeon]